MEQEVIGNIIEKFGYIGLYFWLWFGMFGVPIPNEVIVSTIGYLAATNIFRPILIYIVTYFGLLSATTTSYLMGKIFGSVLLNHLKKRKKINQHIERSLALIDKYHSFSLTISYFLPGLRTMVPFVFGISRLSFYKFAIFSYTTVFVWMTLFFLLGYTLGENEQMIRQMSEELVLIATIALLAFSIFNILRRKRRNGIKRDF